MQRDFLSCLRTAHTLPRLPLSAPPCGGIGVDYWDGELAQVFTRLCTLPDDGKRIAGLESQISVFTRHACQVELGDDGNFKLRDDLMACAEVLRGWRDQLVADCGRLAA